MPGFRHIDQLTYLNKISDVKFTLHGGVAFRYALLQTSLEAAPTQLRAESTATPSDQSIDLFDLAPFTTDIDLSHSGPPAPGILEQILRHVPNADCFRWDIRSEWEQERIRSFLSYGIPARQLSL